MHGGASKTCQEKQKTLVSAGSRETKRETDLKRNLRPCLFFDCFQLNDSEKDLIFHACIFIFPLNNNYKIDVLSTGEIIRQLHDRAPVFFFVFRFVGVFLSSLSSFKLSIVNSHCHLLRSGSKAELWMPWQEFCFFFFSEVDERVPHELIWE